MPAPEKPKKAKALKRRPRHTNRDLAKLFGRNMVRHRKKLRISQEEVGFRADLHRTAIGLLERGEREPQLETIIKVAGALEVDPADLFVGYKELPGEGWRVVEEQRGGPVGT